MFFCAYTKHFVFIVSAWTMFKLSRFQNGNSIYKTIKFHKFMIISYNKSIQYNHRGCPARPRAAT